jgi:hypothetical protein
MTPAPFAPHRALFAIAASIAFVAIAACGDPYGATNPYDPDTPVTFTITGPDTLFSLGELAHYTVQTVPAFPDTAYLWEADAATIVTPGLGSTSVNGAAILTPSSAGSYTSIEPPLEPANATVVVQVLVGSVDTTLERYIAPNYVTIRALQPRHVGSKNVIVMQRLTKIQLRCPATHACDTLSAGGTWSVWVDGTDARGLAIATLPSPSSNPVSGPPIAVYAVRDTTVATLEPVGVRSATVTAVKPGTTWIVGTRGALSDSLQLVVR